MEQEIIRFTKEEMISSQTAEELVSQYLEFSEELKHAKEAVDFIKKELSNRITESGDNLDAGNYNVIRTVRKGAVSMDKEKLKDYIKDMGADWDLFTKHGKASEGIKVEKKIILFPKK